VARLSAFIVSAVLVLLALVFAMAWWTTWKARPKARVWGIAASLANLFGPLSVIYFRHQPLNDSRWKVIVVSALAFISYAWPDSEKDSLAADHFEADDSTPQ
jgi:hypothetical protein